MSDLNLTSLRESACEAARRGAAVLEKWRAQFQVREKGRFDLVTDADVESQQTIRDYLLQQWPDHHFLGEEGPDAEQRPPADSPPLWIVDPLDGTTNYVHDCPLYAVSIGLWFKEEMIVGVVYEPSRDEMFHAAKGQGASVNDRLLKVSDTSTLEQALLGVGFPPQVEKHSEALKYWERFSTQAQALRRTGSTAINLAYVAAGRFDGFWDLDNHVWDVAGGTVLVQEAGGVLTDMDGSLYDPFTPDGIASNGILQPQLLEMFQE